MAIPTIQTAPGINDKSTYLVNGGFARLANMPASWTKIRVGARMTLPQNQTPDSTPKLGVGFCKGTTNILTDPSTDLFIGAYTKDTASWTFDPQQNGPFDIQALAREGSVNTYGAALITNAGSMANLANNNVTAFFVELRKNNAGSTYVNHRFIRAQGMSSATFLAYMQSDAPGGFTVGTEQLVNHTLPATDLNAVNFYWSHPTIGIYICEIAVSKLA